jgi:alpha-N-acetylglucosaminidase
LTNRIFPDPAAETALTAVREVLQRFIGKRSKELRLELMPAENGLPSFEVGATNGLVAVRGSDGVALCRGAYEYLRDSCGCLKTWGGEHLNLPAQWPDAPTRHVSGPYRYRLQDNICTFGYTTAFYGWPEWERYLDVMALHGYNLQMAPVGGEAIWLRVWKLFGVSDASARQWLTGPAFLPWQRMGNVYGHDGPVPASYFPKSIALQKKILGRMRVLGIEPIAPAFSGFVPHGFKEAAPEAQTIRMSGWCGFTGVQAAEILHPLSPYYPKIGAAFIREWQQEFGPAKFFQADSFNEMRAPVSQQRATRLQELAGFGEAVYSAIKAGNPDGTWVMMSWLFMDHGFWDKESAAALLSKVPDDKMLILDLFCDGQPQWNRFDAFFGKPWVLSTIPTWGGNSQVGANLPFFARAIPVAPAQPKAGRLVGFGYSPEGTENNEIVYELASDAAWSREPIQMDKWLETYCRARYGSYPAPVREAWRLLCESVYGKQHGTVLHRFQQRPGGGSCGDRWYSSERVARAVDLLLQSAPELRRKPLFCNDVLEITAQHLGAQVDQHLLAGVALLEMDRSGADPYLAESAAVLRGMDELLSRHTLHRLDRWVQLARRWGDTTAEQDYYEQDARRQVTVWGGPQLSEYAARYWNGLISSYYLQRWNAWLAAQRDHTEFDQRRWEQQWISTVGEGGLQHPISDVPIAQAKRLIEMTRGWTNDLTLKPIGHWRSGEPAEIYALRDWDVTESVKEAGNYLVWFRYTGGSHRLDIEWAALVVDGVERSRDSHESTTGVVNKGNHYALPLADYKPGSRYVLRANIKSAGGRDSKGDVLFCRKPNLVELQPSKEK